MSKTSEYIYLDNAATTPIDPKVVALMQKDLSGLYGNPSSLHPIGVRAHRVLEESRELLSGMLGTQSLIFTGGGTEATNLVMRGVLAGKEGAGILIGVADHPSVVKTAKALQQQGHSLATYPVDRSCQPKMDAFAELLDPELRFVSLLYGHNEVGSLCPIDALVKLIRDKAPRAHVHVDAVQAFAKLPVDLDHMDVDSITIAAHKIHGPKGVGALALGPKKRPAVTVTGGGQEDGLRSGTENVCGNHAFARAAENWISKMSEESGRIQAMRDRAQDVLLEMIPDLHVLGDPKSRLPHILPLAIPGVAGEVLMHHLEDKGICISTGSACSSIGKSKKGSSTLEAMGLPQPWIKGTIRVSFGRLNREADCDALLEELPGLVKMLRDLGL